MLSVLFCFSNDFGMKLTTTTETKTTEASTKKVRWCPIGNGLRKIRIRIMIKIRIKIKIKITIRIKIKIRIEIKIKIEIMNKIRIK